MRVCIIGAGSSGIAAAKALTDRQIDFDWFEMASDVGGNWRYDNDNGRSAAYASLHIDTSKHRMAFSDLPMPEQYPIYPHHAQVFDYFRQYVAEFDLRSRITFSTMVVSVVPVPGGVRSAWDVRTRSLSTGKQSTRRYAAVLVANGHHWDPRIPTIPGSFDGVTLHSQEYRTPDILRGKRVVILGVGNSGADIAVEAGEAAKTVYLASRRGAHVIPRYLFGRPTDTFTSEKGAAVPFAVSRVVNQLLLWAFRGPQRWYGFPTPNTPVLAEHPTLSQDLLPLVKAGKIVPKRNIERFDGSQVVFVDGSAVDADVVVFATGYRISFPFLDPSIIAPKNNEIRLYRHVVCPEWPGLFFIGLVQPLGAIMPLAEIQGKWVAELLTGGKLPPPDEMERRIDSDRAAVRSRYVPSPRHTIQVDFFPYKKVLEAEIVTARRLGAFPG